MMEPAESSGKASRTGYVLCNKNMMTLTCEWADCKDVYDNMQDFVSHLTTAHVQKLFPPDIQPVSESLSLGGACEWRGCSFEWDSLQELVRHIYFHGFHIKLKSIGMSMTLGKNLKHCILDSASRNMIPDLPERFHCGWRYCVVISDNAELFYQHVHGHVEEYPKGHKASQCMCQWEGCDHVLKNRYKLLDHLRSHTQEKMAACPTCGSLFSSSTKFVDHLRRQDDINVQSYQCSHCSKRFSTERLLRDHMRKHVNNYKCPFCEMTTPSPSTLRQHIKYRHSDERDYQCSHCQASFKVNRDLLRHLETKHGDDSRYKCTHTDCPYRSKHEFEIKAHLRNKHNNNVKEIKYKCDSCEHLYVRGHGLTLHLMNKHKFSWPPGHRRFRYKIGSDGHYHLQTVRYESYELSQQLPPEEEDKSAEGSKRLAKKARKDGKGKSPNIKRTKTKTKVKDGALDLSKTVKGSQSDKAPTAIPVTPVNEKQDGDQTETPNSASYNLDMLGEVASIEKTREERRSSSQGGASGDINTTIMDAEVSATSTPLGTGDPTIKKGVKTALSDATPKRMVGKRRKSALKKKTQTTTPAKDKAESGSPISMVVEKEAKISPKTENLDETTTNSRKRKRKDDSPTKLLRQLRGSGCMETTLDGVSSGGQEVAAMGMPRMLQFVTEDGKVLLVQTDMEGGEQGLADLNDLDLDITDTPVLAGAQDGRKENDLQFSAGVQDGRLESDLQFSAGTQDGRLESELQFSLGTQDGHQEHLQLAGALYGGHDTLQVEDETSLQDKALDMRISTSAPEGVILNIRPPDPDNQSNASSSYQGNVEHTTNMVTMQIAKTETGAASYESVNFTIANQNTQAKTDEYLRGEIQNGTSQENKIENTLVLQQTPMTGELATTYVQDATAANLNTITNNAGEKVVSLSYELQDCAGQDNPEITIHSADGVTVENVVNLQAIIENSDNVRDIVTQGAKNSATDDNEDECDYYTVVAEHSEDIIGLVSSKTGEYTPLPKGYILSMKEGGDGTLTLAEKQGESTVIDGDGDKGENAVFDSDKGKNAASGKRTVSGDAEENMLFDQVQMDRGDQALSQDSLNRNRENKVIGNRGNVKSEEHAVVNANVNNKQEPDKSNNNPNPNNGILSPKQSNLILGKNSRKSPGIHKRVSWDHTLIESDGNSVSPERKVLGIKREGLFVEESLSSESSEVELEVGTLTLLKS